MTPFAFTTTKTFTFSSSSSSWTRRERRRERSLSGSFSSCSSNSLSLSSFNSRNFAQNQRHFQRSEKKKTTTQIKANLEDYDIVPKSGGKAKGGFVGGLLIGGAIFGALGFLFAPQLSKHILKGKKVLDDLLEEEEEESIDLESERRSSICCTGLLSDLTEALPACFFFHSLIASAIMLNLKRIFSCWTSSSRAFVKHMVLTGCFGVVLISAFDSL